MPKCAALCAVVLALLPAGAVAAQDSPYAGMTGRPIKALSASDIEGLQAGAGMGFALAAELNGYPGPKHVLELADSLALSPEQTDSVRAIRARMEAEAIRLGAEVVAAEARLDSLFAGGDASHAGVEAAVLAAGRARAELRAAHLVAHIDVTALLSRHQRHRYQELRGYGDGAGHEHGAGH